MAEYSKTKQAAWVAVGSILSHIFTILSTIVLSRFLQKEDYGTYQQVIYVYTSLLSIFTLGLPRAYSYFLPRVENNEAKDVINKINRLFFILGGVFSISLFVCAPFIAQWMRNPALGNAIRIFSPVPFLMLPTMGLEGILATYKKTKFLAIYNTTSKGLLFLFCIIPVILWSGTSTDALVGFVVASFFSFILALYLKYYPVRSYKKKTSSIKVKSIFNLSLPLLTASIWGMLIAAIDQFFISRYFGINASAEFSNGSLEMPLIPVVLGACSTVLSPVFSRMQHERLNPKESIYPIWKSTMDKVAKITVPCILYCIFFSDIIMVTLYGTRYLNSAGYFCIISFYSFFKLIIFAPLLINTGRVRLYSKGLGLCFVCILSLDLVFVLFVKSPLIIPLISILCKLGLTFFFLGVIARYFDVKLMDLFPVKTLLKIAVISIIILSLERIIFTHLNMPGFITIVLSGILYIMVFVIASKTIELDYNFIYQVVRNGYKKKC